MINRIHLQYFRRHEDLSLSFAPGVNVLRGFNERGKTTILEGVGYALFGAKACRQPLDQVVTWGHKIGKLRVEFNFTLDGINYNIVRSKSGAELNFDGGVVTGQTEVTAYIERLFGVPAALATQLWFANQQSIRGALGEGSRAAAALIEQLADFRQLDDLISLLTEHWPTGSSEPYRDRISQAQAFVDSYQAIEPPSQELVKEAADSKDALESMRSLEVTLTQTHFNLVNEHDEKITAFRDLNVSDAHLETLAKEAESRKHAYESIEVPAEIDTDKLAQLEQDLHRVQAREKEQARIKAAREALKNLPDVTDLHWEGDAASFAEEKTSTMRALADIQNQLVLSDREYAVLKQQLITESHCGLCGKDLQDVPEVAAKNTEISRKMKEIEQTKADLKEKRTQTQWTLDALTKIEALTRTFERVIDQYSGWIEATDDRVPPNVKWVGPELSDLSVEPVVLTRQIADLRSAQRLRIQRAEQHRLALNEFNLAREKLEKEEERNKSLRATAQGAEEAITEISKLMSDLTDLRETIVIAAREADKAAQALEIAQTRYESSLKGLEQAKAVLVQAQNDLAEFEFHKEIIKKIRAARPQVVDRLWTVVLNAVSFYFSRMRGTASTVARDSGIFVVDGNPIEGLSGSTLDILGLAVRVALLKTFLPTCPFIILDEAGASMDESREAAMIGTIAAAGFDQTLLITHSDVADAFADELIEVA